VPYKPAEVRFEARSCEAASANVMALSELPALRQLEPAADSELPEAAPRRSAAPLEAPSDGPARVVRLELRPAPGQPVLEEP